MIASEYDAIVIGGGFYGCSVALHLRRRGFERVVVVERESELLARASYRNQARVHHGYHYPRSFVTAYRSRVSFTRFCREFSGAIGPSFTQLYAIARKRSMVTPPQYERFLKLIGAPFKVAGAEFQRLFDRRLIAAVYVTEEAAFDAVALRLIMLRELARASIEVWVGSEIVALADGGERIRVEVAGGRAGPAFARYVMNCSYARMNYNVRDRQTRFTPIKHEFTEIALVKAPPELASMGITVMDGAFWSCMPFPPEGCHSLSHVRYTPRTAWLDTDGARDPYAMADSLAERSHAALMVADGARYVPCLRKAEYRKSLYEVKSVLQHHEADDGRPIAVRREAGLPNVVSILGGKIDNIYDVQEKLDELMA